MQEGCGAARRSAADQALSAFLRVRQKGVSFAYAHIEQEQDIERLRQLALIQKRQLELMVEIRKPGLVSQPRSADIGAAVVRRVGGSSEPGWPGLRAPSPRRARRDTSRAVDRI
jgi:hypothetical protein